MSDEEKDKRVPFIENSPDHEALCELGDQVEQAICVGLARLAVMNELWAAKREGRLRGGERRWLPTHR